MLALGNKLPPIAKLPAGPLLNAGLDTSTQYGVVPSVMYSYSTSVVVLYHCHPVLGLAGGVVAAV